MSPHTTPDPVDQPQSSSRRSVTDLLPLDGGLQISRNLARALRSGEYHQGQATLKRLPHPDDMDNVTRHCCLGVLCELLPQEMGQWQAYGGSLGYNLLASYPEDLVDDWALADFGHEAIERGTAYPPLGLLAIVDDADRDTAFQSMRMYAMLNDTGVSFSVIADLLETYGLFGLTKSMANTLRKLYTEGWDSGFMNGVDGSNVEDAHPDVVSPMEEWEEDEDEKLPGWTKVEV